MSNHQPFEKINKFIITERALNYILRPVQVRTRKYPYTYRVENLNEKVSVTVDQAWTSYNHLVLDIIGHELYTKAYKQIHENRDHWKNDRSMSFLMHAGSLLRYSDRDTIIRDDLKQLVPKYRRFCELIDVCDKHQQLCNQNKPSEERIEFAQKLNQEKIALQQELQYYMKDLHEVRDLIFEEKLGSVQIEFRISKVIQHYDNFFKGRRKEYFKNLLRKTSAVRFSFKYPIRVPVFENVGKNGENQTIIKNVDLKEIKIENDRCFNVEIDGDNVLILFNSFLGRAYVHNLLTLNTDWFEQDFLNLDGYAAAIYRRFFVTRSGNTVDQIAIKDIVEHFGLMKNSYYPAVVEKAFGAIKNAGLIQDYRFVVNGGKFSKGYIQIEKSSK